MCVQYNLRVVTAAIVGGTVSHLTGGKFANGALTGAWSRAFNDEAIDSLTELINGMSDRDNLVEFLNAISYEKMTLEEWNTLVEGTKYYGNGDDESFFIQTSQLRHDLNIVNFGMFYENVNSGMKFFHEVQKIALIRGFKYGTGKTMITSRKALFLWVMDKALEGSVDHLRVLDAANTIKKDYSSYKELFKAIVNDGTVRSRYQNLLKESSNL